MKRSTRIILSGMVALFLYAGMAGAQVPADGDLAFTVSKFQVDNPPANNPESFIIRNRLDSGCCWTISADAVIMSRSGGKSSIMLLNPITGEELQNSNGFNFPWAAGPRVGIVAEDLLYGCDVEASYFGIDEWSLTKNIVAPADGANFLLLNNPALTLNVLPGQVVNYNYISRLHSAEINLRHPLWERLSVLMGFRDLELHEELNARIGNAPVFDVNVDNHLYGGQIGLNVAFVNTCSYSIEGVVKVGVYGNHSDLAMRIPDLIFGDKTSHTAVQGEIGLMGIYQVTEHLAARLGYQAMWIDGIAIASDQVENANTANPKPYMGGTLFYHGATAGFEYAF
jgi:hypothetical protein